MLTRLIGSDVVFWAGLHVARDLLIERVYATSPEQVASASPADRTRVHAVLDSIVPVSWRAEGLRSGAESGKSLLPYALESIVAPTLIVSTRDDGYGTFASAQYTANRIAGARFMAFEHGCNIWVGPDAAIQAAIIELPGRDLCGLTNRRNSRTA